MDRLAQFDANGDLAYMSERLRRKAKALLALQPCGPDEAGSFLQQTLAPSRRQGARALGLRSATDLAALWADRREPAKALALLQPALALFDDGMQTAGLAAAASLLSALA